jgi:hypothetical protein
LTHHEDCPNRERDKRDAPIQQLKDTLLLGNLIAFEEANFVRRHIVEIEVPNSGRAEGTIPELIEKGQTMVGGGRRGAVFARVKKAITRVHTGTEAFHNA